MAVVLLLITSYENAYGRPTEPKGCWPPLSVLNTPTSAQQKNRGRCGRWRSGCETADRQSALQALAFVGDQFDQRFVRVGKLRKAFEHQCLFELREIDQPIDLGNDVGRRELIDRA